MEDFFINGISFALVRRSSRESIVFMHSLNFSDIRMNLLLVKKNFKEWHLKKNDIFHNANEVDWSFGQHSDQMETDRHLGLIIRLYINTFVHIYKIIDFFILFCNNNLLWRKY